MLNSPMMNIFDALILYEQKSADLLARHQSTARPLKIYPSHTLDKLCGVEKSDNIVKRKYLVLGTGRCGTTYMSSLLSSIGLDVPHLKVGNDGSVSHYLMVDHDWYPASIYDPSDVAHIGERASDFIFAKVIHLVREPLSTIRSLSMWMSKADMLFWEDSGVVPSSSFWSKDSDYWNGMLMYYYINLYIQKNFADAFLLRLEKVTKDWASLLSFLELPYVDMPEIAPQNEFGTPVFTDDEISVRKYFGETMFLRNLENPLPRITWDDLYKIDRDLAERLNRLGKEFGYE